MNYKTTLMLVILLALVGGYFYFIEFGTQSGYEAHEAAVKQTTDRPKGEIVFADLAGKQDTIDRIDIARGDQSFTVMKRDGKWRQTEPVYFPLNGYTPEAVARQFAELRYLEHVTPGDADAPTLTQMGLDSPRAMVTVWADGKDTMLRLGKLTLGGNGYVQVQGETDAYVVDAAIFGSVLDTAVTDWRSTSLNMPKASAADRIEQRNLKGQDLAANKVDGRWEFDSEAAYRIDQDAVDSWFSSLGGVWINAFIKDNPDNLALYGLEQPALQFKVYEPAEGDEQIAHTLHIGSTDLAGEHRYAAWTRGNDPISVIFSVNAAGVEGLAKTFADLRDPKVLPADAENVRGVVVRQNEQATLNLVRDLQAGYSFGEPDPGFKPDYSASRGLITNLCALRSENQLETGEITGEPIATVRMNLANRDDGLRFAIYDRGEDRAIVSEGESVGYLVKAAELDTLLGPPLGLRDRNVLDIEPGSITRMTLRRDDGVSFTFEPTAAGDTAGASAHAWQLVGADDYDRQAIESLVNALNPLRAQRWLAERVSPSAGWIEWTIEPIGGAPITVSVDPQTGDALATGVGSAFVLPKSMLTRLTAEYRGQTVLNIELDQIESVRLAHDETDVTISRDSGRRYVSDAGDITQPVAAAVFDTLAGLRAKRFTPADQTPDAEPSFTVELTTRDGQTNTLRVFDTGGDTSLVTLESPGEAGHHGAFTLSRADTDRLRAPLGDIESPVK